MSKVEKSVRNRVQKDKQLKMYGEFNLAAVLGSFMTEEEFLSKFDDDSLRVRVELETPDGRLHEIEILDSYVDWCNLKDI